MPSYKNKLFNYEATPPGEIWQNIAGEIQDEKVINISTYKKYFL